MLSGIDWPTIFAWCFTLSDTCLLSYPASMAYAVNLIQLKTGYPCSPTFTSVVLMGTIEEREKIQTKTHKSHKKSVKLNSIQRNWSQVSLHYSERLAIIPLWICKFLWLSLEIGNIEAFILSACSIQNILSCVPGMYSSATQSPRLALGAATMRTTYKQTSHRTNASLLFHLKLHCNQDSYFSCLSVSTKYATSLVEYLSYSFSMIPTNKFRGEPEQACLVCYSPATLLCRWHPAGYVCDQVSRKP